VAHDNSWFEKQLDKLCVRNRMNKAKIKPEQQLLSAPQTPELKQLD
jgi:ABC-type oligopeptide transport system ATPase subunit